MTWKAILGRHRTRAAVVFDWVLLGLIVYSIITLSIETVPGLSPATLRFLDRSELVVTVIFTIEYLFRLWFAEKRLRYASSFYGLIDLFAILPFYLSVGVDMRALRAFRLLRLFRLLKLARYHRAAEHFGRAFALIRPELVLFMCVTGILLYLSALGIYYFEHEAQPRHFQSVFHSLWWAVVTLTTVGYGDVYPVTTGGKLFASVVLIVGLGVVAVPAGLMASALSKASKGNSDQD